ncbi:MAG: mechanosensitive ion channel family protein [Saprospiraceae bacterium]
MPEIDWESYAKQLQDWSPKLLGAILIIIIGFWIVGNVVKILTKAMERAKLDESLRPFLGSLASVLLKVMVLIAAAGIVGIETTSFVAILASAGLAIGLALQGSLQNFASGVMVLFFKPYKVGDLVKLDGHVGHVLEIQIFNTIIMTPDNRKIIIPNATATSGSIENISGPGKIRVEMVFGIAYGASIDQARQVIQAVSDANDKIMTDPGTDIFVNEHAASSVNLAVRPWCHPDHYWDVYFYMHEELKKAFDREDIGIPYATYDINIIKD